MKLDPKKIALIVKARLAADDPDKEYYTFENDTIKQTSGRDYSLKEWVNLYLDDFTEDIIDIPLKDSLRESLFEEIQKDVSILITAHFKKFFKDNKNKVDEDTWDDELKDLKKQIKNHYWRASKEIEQSATELIRELTDKLKLV